MVTGSTGVPPTQVYVVVELGGLRARASSPPLLNGLGTGTGAGTGAGTGTGTGTGAGTGGWCGCRYSVDGRTWPSTHKTVQARRGTRSRRKVQGLALTAVACACTVLVGEGV